MLEAKEELHFSGYKSFSGLHAIYIHFWHILSFPKNINQSYAANMNHGSTEDRTHSVELYEFLYYNRIMEVINASVE
jgi:hypothetical protein